MQAQALYTRSSRLHNPQMQLLPRVPSPYTSSMWCRRSYAGAAPRWTASARGGALRFEATAAGRLLRSSTLLPSRRFLRSIYAFSSSVCTNCSCDFFHHSRGSIIVPQSIKKPEKSAAICAGLGRRVRRKTKQTAGSVLFCEVHCKVYSAVCITE